MQATRVRPLPYRWLLLGLMTGGNAALLTAFFCLGILLPSIGETLALTPIQAGWLGSAVLLGNLVSSIPLSIWLPRYSPRWVFALCLLAGGVLSLVQGWAPSFGVLFVARLAFGVANMGLFPPMTLLIKRWFPMKEIALVNGISIGVVGIAGALVFSFTPRLLDLLGDWRRVLYVFGVLSIAVACLWLALGRDRTREEMEEAPDRRGLRVARVLRYRALWVAGLGAIGPNVCWLAFATFWPLFMRDAFAMPLTRSGTLFGLISLGSTPGALLVGLLVARFPVRNLVFLACAVAMAMAAAGTLLTSSVTLLALLTVLWGFSLGFLPVAFTVPYELPGATEQEVAVAVAVLSTMLTMGGALGPVLAGFVFGLSGSLFLALMLSGALSLTLLLPGIVLRRAAAS